MMGKSNKGGAMRGREMPAKGRRYAKGGAVTTPDTAKGKKTSGKARGMGAAKRGGSYSCG